MLLIKKIAAGMYKKPTGTLPTATVQKTEEKVSVHEVLVPIRKVIEPEEVKKLSTIERAAKLPFFHGYMPALEATNLLIRSGDFLIRLLEDGNKVLVMVSVGLTSTQSYRYREIEEEEKEKLWNTAEKMEKKDYDGDVSTDIGPTGEEARKNSDSELEAPVAPFQETIAVNVRHLKIAEDEHGCTIDGQTYFSNLYALLAYYMFVKLEEPREFYLRNPINRTYGSFRANEIKVVRILGHGAFGEVALANISHPAFSQDKAAIKTVLKDHPNRRELEEKFIREGRISIPLDQKNVVRTLGWCFDSKPLQLVFEYCPGGALDSYLIANSDQLSNTALTKLCLDAARGLTYLHDVGVLHRDIAARNCLMDAKGNVKIADFGLSVKAYYYEMVVAENLPTRYLAPECLVRFSFNAQTDIFAFGHLVCEIHNKCEIPYAGMSGLEARKEIAAGKVLTVHSRAPEALRLYVADRLFAFHPIYRPAMHEVVGFLKKLLDWLRKRHPNEREVERTVDTSARSVQPSYPKKDLFERMEPSSAAQSPPVDVAE